MAYRIDIAIDHYDKIQAIEALKRTLKEIEEGIVGISAHDESYMPYRYFRCDECDADARKKEINRQTVKILTKCNIS